MSRDDLCTFCGLFPETLIHLFCTCPHTKVIMDLVSDWCISINPNVDFTNKNIIFSSVSSNPKCVTNAIVLIAK